MLRLLVALAIVSFIYVRSPLRGDNGLDIGVTASRLATTLPRPDGAEAAFATLLLRGGLDEAATRLIERPSSPAP